MSHFKKLSVKDIREETINTVSISFEIPTEEKSTFNYQAGQYITIRKELDGEDVRRSYSLCSAPYENDFRIGVKKMKNGKMSSYLNEVLKAGDAIEVLPPAGNFIINDLTANFVGFAAGSGITPLLSMIKSTLNANGRFTLYYGNKTLDDVIFKKELDNLTKQYPEHFKTHYLFSREKTGNVLTEGRINNEKCKLLVKENLELLKADGFYLCGPEEMIKDVEATLKEFGVNENKIHFELFVTPTTNNESNPKKQSDFTGESHVTVIMDGDEFEFELISDGDSVLDAAIEAGVDAPFSCKGAVCCTCKAQIIEGKAIMKLNYSLSDEEVEEGYILTCQSHPASETLVVDYDVT